jgi:hypothetical protein
MASQESKLLSGMQPTIEQCECEALCDFPKNYFFTLPDEAQGHHWNNAQMTIHPFAIYLKTAFLLPLLKFNSYFGMPKTGYSCTSYFPETFSDFS